MGLFSSAALWVRGLLGQAPSRVRLTDNLTIGQLPIWAQLGRIGGAISPEQVATALARAATGEVGALVDLANDARRKDNHLQSILATRELAASTLPWEVVAPEGSRRRDRKAAAWVSEALQQAAGSLDPQQEQLDNLVGFRGLIKHLQGGVYHGFSVSETLYEKAEGKLWPIAWSRLRQRRFRFAQDTGRLCWFDDSGRTPYPGVDLRAVFAPGKLLIHQPDIVGDDPQREGLSNVLLWAALFRNWTLRDIVALAELAWKPWRIGTYKTGADDKHITHLVEALTSLTSSGAALLAETTSLDVEWPGGGGSTSQGPAHLALFGTLGAEMSKSVLGQTLTTEQGSKGSQALGKVHDQVRMAILEFDAQCLAETLRRDLIAPLVWRNFGDVAIPQFRFLTEEAADLKAFGEGLVAMRKAGLKNIPAAWVRDRSGIPEGKEGDEVLGDEEADPEIDIPIDPETGLPVEPNPSADPAAGDENGNGADPAEAPAEKAARAADPYLALTEAVRGMTVSVDKLLRRLPTQDDPTP